jgi:hypothetical protein
MNIRFCMINKIYPAIPRPTCRNLKKQSTVSHPSARGKSKRRKNQSFCSWNKINTQTKRCLATQINRSHSYRCSKAKMMSCKSGNRREVTINQKLTFFFRIRTSLIRFGTIKPKIKLISICPKNLSKS